MAKIAIYESDEFGTRDYVEVFFEEDFLNGHPMLPPYAKAFHDEDGRILPIQVNSAGGYCPHIVGDAPYLGTHIVEYRDYDADVKQLSLEEMHPINRKGFNCGWIAPDGTTYQCAPEGHSICADRIAEELFELPYCRNAERELEERGWMKVYHDSEIGRYGLSFTDDHGIFWDHWAPDSVTPQQISVIKRIGRWTEELQATVRMCSKLSKRG